MITIEINIDEDEYRNAVNIGYLDHYCEVAPDDLSLDDVDDFARAMPYLILSDENTSIS